MVWNLFFYLFTFFLSAFIRVRTIASKSVAKIMSPDESGAELAPPDKTYLALLKGFLCINVSTIIYIFDTLTPLRSDPPCSASVHPN